MGAGTKGYSNAQSNYAGAIESEDDSLVPMGGKVIDDGNSRLKAVDIDSSLGDTDVMSGTLIYSHG